MIDINGCELSSEEQKKYEAMLALAARAEVNFPKIKSKYEKILGILNALHEKKDLTRYEREDLLEHLKYMANRFKIQFETAEIEYLHARTFAEMYRRSKIHARATKHYTEPMGYK